MGEHSHSQYFGLIFRISSAINLATASPACFRCSLVIPNVSAAFQFFSSIMHFAISSDVIGGIWLLSCILVYNMFRYLIADSTDVLCSSSYSECAHVLHICSGDGSRLTTHFSLYNIYYTTTLSLARAHAPRMCSSQTTGNTLVTHENHIITTPPKHTSLEANWRQNPPDIHKLRTGTT